MNTFKHILSALVFLAYKTIIRKTKTLTLETIHIMGAMWIREASLVPEAEQSPDTRLQSPTAISRAGDGIAHASVRKPPRTAGVQTLTPR